MKFAKSSGTLGLMTLAVIVSPLAAADDSGWNGGISIGQTRAKIDEARITSSVLGAGYSAVAIDDDPRDVGYKAFLGYRFNRNFALEGGYFDLGKFGFSARTVPLGTLNGNMRLRGLNIDAVGILPLTDKFSVFGRLGAHHTQARDSFSGTGLINVLNPNPSKRETNYKFGMGFQYDFTPSLGLRVEAERYRINDAIGTRGDVDMVSLGLIYRFGEKVPIAVPPAPQPPPVAAAPPPPPPPPAVVAPPPVVVVAPPPPVVLRKVAFAADSLFGFDQATVSPEGNRPLDKLAADLRGSRYDVITVTGHTDRLGPHAYNLKLSTRRAEAVKTYLVASAGIPAGIIVTNGVNGAEPVTQPGQCLGEKATRKLINCLQPDRRVEVEVTATQVVK